MPNKQKTSGLILLASLLLLAAITLNAAQAQNQATLTILPSGGGITNPAAGTSTHNAGETVTISASADATGSFAYWLIFAGDSSQTVTDNPLRLNVTGGQTYTVQAVIVPFQTAPNGTIRNMTGAAIVVLLASVGGTTQPAPGSYALANATSFNITAIPNNGWRFSHWAISGNTNVTHGGAPFTLEPTDNPYNVDHGYGETYTYQAVFTQSSSTTSPSPSPSATGSSTGSPSPSPTIPELSIIGLVAILLAVVPVAVLSRKFRNK